MDTGYKMNIDEIMSITLNGVKTTCAATITETTTGGQFAGTVEFDWTGRTVADMARFATADRRIALAPSVRKNITSYRSKKTITSRVSAPGVRDAATRIITVSDVETFLGTVDPSVVDDMVARVIAARNTDNDTD